MKKLFVILLAVLAMSVCVLAETAGDTFTLTEYLGLTETSDYIETVEFIIPDESNFERHEIPKEDFLSLAEAIVLTDVEGSPMFMDENGKPSMEWNNGIYIEVLLDESKMEESEDFERFKFAFVSNTGGVDTYTLMFSRLPYKDCVMSEDDVRKLYGLAGISELPEVKSDETSGEVLEAETNAEQMNENAVAEEQRENGENNEDSVGEYNGMALLVVVFVMASAVALTLILTKKKKN